MVDAAIVHREVQANLPTKRVAGVAGDRNAELNLTLTLALTLILILILDP